MKVFHSRLMISSMGLDRGWVRPSTVIKRAVREFEKGNGCDLLIQIASLPTDDENEVAGLLAHLDSTDHIDNTCGPARKWLYLQLKAAYDRHRALKCPLCVVEQIYVDFGYPPSIESFISYMPAQPGDEPGTTAMTERWSDFLARYQPRWCRLEGDVFIFLCATMGRRIGLSLIERGLQDFFGRRP
ncbi:MAG: DUF2247 family protein [Chloroflexota bacterium]